MPSLIRILSYCLCLMPVSAQAVETNITQQLKYNFLNLELPDNSPAIFSGGNSQAHNIFNYRLNANVASDSLDYEIHYEFISHHSDSDNLSAADIDQRRLFQLTDTLSSDQNQIIYHRLDRLSATYKTAVSIFRFGRQAITWGNGLVFNTMDLFNPFSPTAIDKEYKPGDDMLYYQWLTPAGHDWQIIYLPRRDDNDTVSASHTSVTAKYHHIINSLSFDFLMAKHYQDAVVGLGLTYPVGQSMWRFDMTHTQTEDSDNVTALSTNMDYSWTAFSKNIYGFVEYYYNGFGVINSQGGYSADLLTRIERGELFVHNRNYLTGGLRMEYHPLLNLIFNIIHNLDDDSSLFLVGFNYDWKSNLLLQASMATGSGSSTSEFNGPLSAGDSVQVLLNYYF